ncbi:nucleosome assembly protein 1-like 4 isoform X1 [Caretta caretta]|uniref:nucleosome assembly protein 1-like 4 isoform X1 n=1 Tax=Caretta caretta TaxID=8467 RepID=UPI00209605FC|nr:nucleosome assembly protein 1-like 4 isoform X1 [Caretta caretta]XP_048711128.1 nucleosome assembly protein 1-like 4 isoform X1 [Caretta caretta]
MADNSKAEDAASDSVEAAKHASDKKEKLADQVMQNPQVLAALQERLDNSSHTPSSYIETLPKAVKRRIDALKQLQVKCAHIEAKFYEEVHDLERKYAALYQPLFDKRRDFVIGEAEPTDAESEWHSENEEEEKLAGDLKNKVVIEEKEAAAAAEESNPKGIPDFWFTIFRNVDMLSELVQEYDEPILKHLQDIKVKFSEPGQPMSFSLEFYFEPNDYFTNSVLTKTYKMKSEPDKTDPFSFEGPEIVDCEGCTIEWKKGKNVTVKTIKKKQKHKGRGTVRTITKQVPNDSFFNFFSPIKDLTKCKEGTKVSFLKMTTKFDPRFKNLRCLPESEREMIWSMLSEVLEQHSNVETTEPEPPKINLLLVASDSDDESEHVLVCTALDCYRAESVISMDACPLEWWLKHEGTYESLEHLLRKYLATPSTTVPCECLFPLSGDVNNKQAALSPANVNKLVCLSNWLNKK